jgi:hypothetical protein
MEGRLDGWEKGCSRLIREFSDGDGKQGRMN